ncbi:hypothetical protein HNP55_000360 [Paucibacter oligotrophus]|uniref:Uncharacterized protein n=1 Tax=Roseateles oligotrophus TaxID=1769250 RepID=A0A840L5N7_9BURK|nr:hypothetical protein [Roseateles oligotrophus]
MHQGFLLCAADLGVPGIFTPMQWVIALDLVAVSAFERGTNNSEAGLFADLGG